MVQARDVLQTGPDAVGRRLLALVTVGARPGAEAGLEQVDEGRGDAWVLDEGGLQRGAGVVGRLPEVRRDHPERDDLLPREADGADQLVEAVTLRAPLPHGAVGGEEGATGLLAPLPVGLGVGTHPEVEDVPRRAVRPLDAVWTLVGDLQPEVEEDRQYLGEADRPVAEQPQPALPRPARLLLVEAGEHAFGRYLLQEAHVHRGRPGPVRGLVGLVQAGSPALHEPGGLKFAEFGVHRRGPVPLPGADGGAQPLLQLVEVHGAGGQCRVAADRVVDHRERRLVDLRGVLDARPLERAHQDVLDPDADRRVVPLARHQHGAGQEPPVHVRPGEQQRLPAEAGGHHPRGDLGQVVSVGRASRTRSSLAATTGMSLRGAW